MIYSEGDRILIRLKEHRMDDQEIYNEVEGIITQAYNACVDDEDHWQYRIRGTLGQYIQFNVSSDEGTITLIEKAKCTS